MERPDTVDGGRIRLGDPLGQGAQGTVYAARSGADELAVKLVPRASLSPRFAGEARALAAMDHPHVVALHSWGHEGDWAWIATPLMTGGSTLDRLEASGPWPIDDALRLTFDVLCGLAALHHRRIVHRDVKPGNMFIDALGRAVIGDLGVAHLPAGEVNYETATGTNLGTVDYAAPEQGKDAKRVDRRADLYGVGATLFAWVVGRRPSFLYAREEFPQAYEHLPESLHELVAEACAHDPDDRFPDARAMATRVVELLAEHNPKTDPAKLMAEFDELSPSPPWWVDRWYSLREWFAGL